MAGFYVDVPSWRMAWDRDGTQVFSGLTQLSSAQMIALNNETEGDGPYGQLQSVCLIFPELRDVDGYFASENRGQYGAMLLGVQTSTDTTNGIDGTWVAQPNYTPPAYIGTAWRTSIVVSSFLAVKAIKFINYGAPIDLWNTLHLFGEISPNQNPNRLVLWHPTLNQRITPAYFDWGNVPRSSSADKTFRVKNISTVQTANSVRVAQEILTDTAPSVVGQHTLSLDAITFLAQVNIGNLAPGAISTQTLTLRRVTPVDAVLSVWCHRVFAEAGTWV